MDSVDLKILRCLQKNARMKASAISEEINLSVSAVTERIRRLESSGIIRQYTLLLDQQKLNYGIEALMEVRLEHLRYFDTVAAKIQNDPGIVSCYCLTGDCDFMLRIMTNSTESLEKLHREIMGLEGVSTTKTYFIIQHLKENTSLIPN
ncbi:MAG: Lrp/AsnC family transcriptional regulator [Clostridia bacterium]|nr:Lrp/AsnC family transcriptional regulator [Clostridia bacterium]